ncbi:MAG: 4Fe-4S dicluster domain-containing protein [Anaerolineales bacterium]|nr:4Fe-4S dicluster domain-containing protein [Anaerolineales bacterium]
MSAITTEAPQARNDKTRIDWGRIGEGLQDFLVHAVGQVRILKRVYPGIMHLLIFWGVTIQVIGTAINLMQMALFTPFALENFPRGNLYLAYEVIMDLAGVFILVGVAMAVFRRLVLKPKTLGNSWDDYYALALLTLLPLAGFTTEAMRLIASAPDWAAYSFAGNAFASLYRGLGVTPQQAFSLQQVFVLTHISLGLVFVASIPFTKLRHLIFAPLNVVLRPRRAWGALKKIENIEETELLGAGKITEFSSEQLRSFDACLRCGRCEEVCPATNSGMAYSPRLLLTDLREALLGQLLNPNGDGKTDLPELVGTTFSEHDLWSCTTCGACLTRCPAFINPPEQVVELRRYQVLMTGQMPKSVGDTLRNMERQGNPWALPPENRMRWAEGLDVRELAPGDEVDVLLFVGCAAAFDERNKKVVRAFVRLMQQAGVDFGVLGFDESCCGETARRLGNEYLFQVFAEQNIEMFNAIKFRRIVSTCPHCFNTLKNEYPQMGGQYQVEHYTEMLAELLGTGALTIHAQANGHTLAYHDSCYLGRYNDIYQAPRRILDQSGLRRVEMKRQGENSFCCGGGGGMMWMETEADQRINVQRLQEALDVKADTIATACPYCLTMFDDAIRSKGVGEQIEVFDIAEILAQQNDKADG